MSERNELAKDLRSLEKSLVAGGVAPKVIARTIAELRDHYEDLRLDHGKAEARSKLGSFDAIASDLILRRELQSWPARWPWLIYGLLPIVTVAGAIVVAASTVGYVWLGLEWYVGAKVVPPQTIHLAVNAFFWSVAHVLPVGLAVVIGVHALNTRRPLVWPIAGVIALCLAGGALDFSAHWPMPPDGPRTVQVGFSYGPPFPDLPHAVLYGVMNLAIAAGLIALATKVRNTWVSDT